MNSFLLDGRVLVQRVALGPGSAVIDHLFDRVSRDRLSCLLLAVADVLATLVRRAASGRLTPTLFQGALTHLAMDVRDAADFIKYAADNAVIRAALPLIERHRLWATDAILIRVALDVIAARRPAGDDLVLLSTDTVVLRAAKREGLVTFNPEKQTEAELDALIGP